MIRSLARSLPLVVVILFAAVRADAEDRKKITGHDLEMVVDWRWAGCHFGGYFPIRITIDNDGAARDLTLSFRPDDGEALPMVERTVPVERGANVRTTLAVPITGRGIAGTVRVQHEGKPLDALIWHVVLPERETLSPRPGLLIVGRGGVDASNFEAGVNMLIGSGATGHIGGDGSNFGADHEVVEPEALPDRWIDFSGLDIVAIPLPVLDEAVLGEDRVEALVRWVQTGGTLIVDQVDTLPSRSVELESALGMENRALAGREWQNLLPLLVNHNAGVALSRFDQPTAEDWDRTVEFLIGLRPNGEPVDQDELLAEILDDPEPDPLLVRRSRDIALARQQWWQFHTSLWAGSGTVPFVRQLGYGRVIAITGDAFAGSHQDWSVLLEHVAQRENLVGRNTASLLWAHRYGVSPRGETDDFQMFLVPGVRSVPVISFLVLITLFAIVIGPLNYFLLSRRRQLNMLVVTIPVLAALTSLALFGYSTVSHGFSTKSRIRSVTLLDERSDSAITTSRVAMFSGMAPSSGLVFDRTTAVHPIWPEGHDFRGAHVTWDGEQRFDSGWLRSRTRTQFQLVQSRELPDRIAFGPATGSGLEVTNELSADVDFLLVRGEDGRFHIGRNLAVGESSELPLATEDDLVEFRSLLRRHPMAPPEVSAFGGSDIRTSPARDGRGPEIEGGWTRYSGSVAERMIARLPGLVDADAGGFVDPSNAEFDYVAVLIDDPYVDLGLERTRREIGYHLVIGFR